MKDGQLLYPHRVSAASEITLALLAGFIASVAMVAGFAGAYLTALLLGRLPLPILAGWFRGLTNNALIDTAKPNLYAATALFFGGGLLWAVLYGLVVERRLSGPSWRRGLLFALGPWIVSLAVVMPLVGGGILGFGLGAGPLPIIGNLVLHAIYGVVLGLVYGGAESVVDRPQHQGHLEDLQAGHVSELGAARGLLIGLLLGTVGGLLLTAVVPWLPALNPLALAVALALTGAAFGAFIGSLSSVGSRT